MASYTPKFTWAKWEDADALITKSKADSHLVIVCFVQTWVPPAVHTGEVLAMYSSSGKLPNCSVLIINADTEPKKSAELGYSQQKELY